MNIDLHVHLYGRGDGATGCQIRGRFFTSILIPFLKYYHRIPEAEIRQDLDSSYLNTILRDFLASTSIDGMVFLAHDRIYRDDGSIDPRTQLYTPNDYVLGVMNRDFPQRELHGRNKKIFAGVSVHPNRKDAVDELIRCREKGAVLVKLLPDSQNFDPLDKRYGEYYKTLSELGLPLLAHTGGEHILKTLNKQYRDPERLKYALDCGVTVIAAHCGLKTGLFDTSYYETFSSMTRQYPHFYGDTSGFIIPTRRRGIRKLLKDDGALKKLVHGSDIPVPCIPASLAGMTSFERIRKIAKIRNPFEKDYLIKKAIGFPDEVFSRFSAIIGRKKEP